MGVFESEASLFVSVWTAKTEAFENAAFETVSILSMELASCVEVLGLVMRPSHTNIVDGARFDSGKIAGWVTGQILEYAVVLGGIQSALYASKHFLWYFRRSND